MAPVFQNLLAYAYERRSFVATYILCKNIGAPFLIIDVFQPAEDLEKSVDLYASLGDLDKARIARERMNNYLVNLFSPHER